MTDKQATTPYRFGRLDGKIAIVAGAGNPKSEGHGIGATTSLQLARNGATVISVSNVEENAQTITEAIKAEGLPAIAHVCDVTKTEGVQALVNRVKDEFGQIDIMINAGVHNAMPNGFHKMTEDYWRSAIDINLHAHFLLIHGVLPTFVEQESGGCLLHYSTIAGEVGLGLGKQRHSYAAGKSGAAVLTKRIGIEYAKEGVRGNVIQIGYINGPLVNRAVAAGGADIEMVTARRDSYVPRGKQGTPADVANMAAFLCSDEASLLNGSDFFVDGGTAGCTYGP
jgi:3-oxoacyl-[acyl-carrier protein] reductase